MRILGCYPKNYGNEIRVNASSIELRDRVVIGIDSYFVIAADTRSGNRIVLDRPLERATEWSETIVFGQPRKVTDDDLGIVSFENKNDPIDEDDYEEYKGTGCEGE